jgi:uncharacterized ubiquitin-like protein YukD
MMNPANPIKFGGPSGANGPLGVTRGTGPSGCGFTPMKLVDMNGSQTLHELGITRYGPENQTPLVPIVLNPVLLQDNVGNVMPIDITPNMGINELKQLVYDVSGMAPQDQQIIYAPHSVIDGLNEGVLVDYGVPATGNAILSLNPNRLDVHMKTPEGMNKPLNVDMTDTIDSLKRKIQDASGVPIAEQKIYYINPNGDNKPVELIRGDMIDNDVTAGGVVLLNPIMCIAPSGETFPVDVQLSGPVSALKSAIAKQAPGTISGMNSPQQVCFRGQVLEESVILAKYGVADGSVNCCKDPKMSKMLYVNAEPFKLTVHTNQGDKFDLQVDPSFTVDKVLEMVANKTHPIAGETQKLMVIVNGSPRQLMPQTSLSDYGINKDTPLYLNPLDIRVFVKVPNGKVHILTVNMCDTPYQVIKKVEPVARSGDLTAATMIYGVEEVEEDKCLADYDVVADSTLRLQFQTKDKDGDTKKWEVDTGNYIWAQQKMKVDYGEHGIAPPSAPTVGGLDKFKKAAGAIKAANTVQGMQKQLSVQVQDVPQEDDEEAILAAQQAKHARALSVLQHQATAKLGGDEASMSKRATAEDATLTYLDDSVDKNDMQYKYTLCLLTCCPCLRPNEEDKDLPAKAAPRGDLKIRER